MRIGPDLAENLVAVHLGRQLRDSSSFQLSYYCLNFAYATSEP